MRKTTITLLALLFATLAHANNDVILTVKNPTAEPREQEMVETDAQAIASRLGTEAFIITDADGNEIPSQITHDGKLIFRASAGSRSKTVYHAVRGERKKYASLTGGRLFHERGTEFGWENDRVAYRIYGGGAAVGYDLFNKNTEELMLDYWYGSEQNKEMRSLSKQLRERGYTDLADEVYNAFCYHINHGKGMDCYTVGPTLGAGANALVRKDGTLCMPKCYSKYEILDRGPLRFTVRLSYPEIDYEGQTVTETRTVTLDAGSHFNKVSVRYEGLSTPAQIASGVVVHKQNPDAYVMSKEKGYVGYEDLGDVGTYSYIPKKYHEKLASEMGRIYVGTFYPSRLVKTEYKAQQAGAALGHALAIADYTEGFTYYFGSGWSLNAQHTIDSLAAWERLLERSVRAARAPMKVTVR